MTTSTQVRAELENLIERELLGPWDGPDEELPPRMIPAERYLLGRLVPKPSVAPADQPSTEEPLDASSVEVSDPDLMDGEVTLDAADTEDRESSSGTRTGSMAASSLGLSFMVPGDVDVVVVHPRWGRYERTLSQTHESEQGKARSVWKRTPGGAPVEIRLDTVGRFTEAADSTLEGVAVSWTVSHRDRGRGPLRMVHVALVNGLPHLSSSPDINRLYQAGITVTALDGHQAIFVGHNDPELTDPFVSNDPERLRLEMLHRRTRKFATGSQCAVDAERRDGEVRAWRLGTTSFPATEISPVIPGDASTMPGLVLDMNRLGNPELAADDLVGALRPLVAGYRAWLDTQEARIANEPEVARFQHVPLDAIADARGIAERLDRAVDLLRDDGLAREAFRFANQAMARQRVRGELVRARLSDPTATVTGLLRTLDVPRNRSWRPFQLAFVLLALPGLTDPTHPDAHRGPDDGQAQLLYFPTGGGKTEAYLGLTAYTLAIRRLQGIVGSGADARDGSDGVAVLMRYTLRLLTAQQFQRAAALICACEWLRHERIANGDSRWGSTPFRLGLWVGSSVTPNTFEDAKGDVERAVERGGDIGGPLQLTACPWCGERLDAGRDLQTDAARRRVLLYCGDPDGLCPFSRKRAAGEGLPVLTVDEEIYRLTPSLVISTVDKFAQLPWKGGTGPLFGLVDTHCPRHGWQTPDTASFCTPAHKATAHLPAVQARPVTRLRPPDLVIQDELHLIGDALGSMVGLFESVIDRLASRAEHGRTVRPVVVASTATVRRARDQVSQVFARGLVVFPPEVLDAGETFFSTRVTASPGMPGRRYRGICAPGERMKAVSIRVFSALLSYGQLLLDRHGEAADPYLTLVGYFSSTRELAGTRRLVDDDVTGRLSSQAVSTRRRAPTVTELTSRMPSSRIATTLADLERSFDAQHDSTAGLDTWRAADAATRQAMPVRERPIDVLLATSMLQVGVDVPRLGLMVVNGQPKNTAEYIQATSRVGRVADRPGLVFTIFNWSRPRDLAHFESFGYDHSTFGMRVEGVTTTPFSDRALDRGLTAVLATAIRHQAFGCLPNRSAHTVSLSGPLMQQWVEAVVERAEAVTHDTDWSTEVRRMIKNRLDAWDLKRTTLPTGVLGFQAEAGVSGLLQRPDVGAWTTWSVPMSLREVEPEVLLQIDTVDRSLETQPEWTYVASTSPKA